MLYKSGNISGDQLTFFDDNQLAQLLLNGSGESHGKDHIPVACLEFKLLGYKWLITEINPLNPDLGYGLICANDKVQIGQINLHELDTLRGEQFASFNSNLNDMTEDDLEQAFVSSIPNFRGNYPLSIYFSIAKKFGVMEVEQGKRMFLEETLNLN